MVAHLVWDQRVGSSNLSAPTIFKTLPKIEDLDNRVQNSMSSVQKHSDKNTDSDNRKAGVNTNSEGLMKEGEYGE